jgi:glycosyltransferase involved in cell wall biosynthesis
MPYFSIIIPTYNRADLISISISSVLNQTFTDFELIVIDDFSDDNTKDIVHEFTDKRLTYYKNEKNLERSETRNRGIEFSSGTFVMFLDSDDYFLENHLSEFYTEIQKQNEESGIYFSNKLLKKDEALIESTLPPINKNKVEYFLLNTIMPCQVCISKKVLETKKFNKDCIIIEDSVLWMQIASEYNSFQINKFTNVYLVHDSNSVNVKINNAYKLRLDGLKIAFKDKLISNKLSKKIMNNVLSDCYFGIFNYYYFQKNTFKKITTMLEAILLYPNIKLKNKIYLLLSCLPLFSNYFKYEL